MTDFQQLRWQLVRAIEGQQAVELENRILREKLGEIDETKKRSLNFVVGGIKKWLSTSREALTETKAMFEAEKYGVLSEMANIKEQLLMMQQLQLGATEDQDTLKLENASLASQNNALQQQLLELEAEQRAEHNRHSRSNEIIEQLEREVKERTEEIDTREAEVVRLRGKLEDSQRNVAELENKMSLNATGHEQVLTALRSEVRHLQAELSGDRMRFEEERIDVATRHEHEVHRLREDYNQALIKLDDQEDYIAKLTNMLMGSKTNFGKFVELKAENANLQLRLEQQQGMGAKKGRSGMPQQVPVRPAKGAGMKGSANTSVLRGTRVTKQLNIAGGEGDNLLIPHAQSQDMNDQFSLTSAPLPSDRTGYDSAVVSANPTPRHILQRETSDEEMRILAGYAHAVSSSPPPRAVPPPAVPTGAVGAVSGVGGVGVPAPGSGPPIKKNIFAGEIPQATSKGAGLMLNNMRRR